jgi:hypothetical protein
MLWKQPRFSIVALLTLTLGIGATAAIFSVVYGVLLKPLPFPDPDRLVALYHVTPAGSEDQQGDATYFTYREQGRVFEDIGLWSAGPDVSVTRNGREVTIRCPLRGLGYPETIMTSARSYKRDVPLDWMSWRLIEGLPRD